MERVVTFFFLSTVAMYTASAIHPSPKEKADLADLSGQNVFSKQQLLDNLVHAGGQRQMRYDLMSTVGNQYYTPLLRDILQNYYAGVPDDALKKRSEGSREKKELELAYLLHNLILELDSEEAKNLSGTRRFKSVSGESSGEMTRGPAVEAGSKRKYGNIFHGPMETKARAPPRPRRQRKFRIDPVMFWMGIGK